MGCQATENNRTPLCGGRGRTCRPLVGCQGICAYSAALCRKPFTDNQIKILKCEKKQLAGPQSGSFTARLGGLGPEKIVRHVQLEVGVVRLSRGAEGPRSREAKARGRSYESGTNIVFCESQVGAGVPGSLYISPRRLFSKVCRFVDT